MWELVKMGKFSEAYAITRQHEGDYDNNPNDRGGETFKGVARNFNPDWDGWPIIDGFKDLHEDNFINYIKNDERLNELVHSLYKKKYWDVFRGDSIPNHAQDIANELFDTGVNASPSKAIKFLQRALNALNNNQKKYPDIEVDGGFGDQTYKTLILHLDAFKADCKTLYKVMNILQGEHYIKLMEKDHRYEEWVGWFNRIDILK